VFWRLIDLDLKIDIHVICKSLLGCWKVLRVFMPGKKLLLLHL